MRHTIKTVGLLLLISLSLSARNQTERFGKIKKADFSITECPIDPAAKAFYFFDKGECDFSLGNAFAITLERHLRIKILDVDALDQGTFNFRFFVNDNAPDYELYNIKAQTYNLTDGDISISSLHKDSIYYHKENKHTQLVSFSMPDVKAGSIIEVVYHIKTSQLNKILPWQFQYDIPVLHSTYYVEFPEFYNYRMYPYGSIPFSVSQISDEEFATTSDNTKMKYLTENIEYEAKNIPAVSPEDDRPLSDISSKIVFELTRIEDLPEVFYKSITHAKPFSIIFQNTHIPNWKDVNDFFRASQDFGYHLEQAEGLAPIITKIKEQSADSLTQIYTAYNAIKAAIKWNETNSCFACQSTTQSLKTGSGNSADINLSLVALLRQMGYNASPVVLSTVDNGYLRKHNPSAAPFNYVIVACAYRGSLLLMDASDIVSSINALPARCLNGEGLLIDETSSRWISIVNILQ